jgi:hypothetical protein
MPNGGCVDGVTATVGETAVGGMAIVVGLAGVKISGVAEGNGFVADASMIKVCIGVGVSLCGRVQLPATASKRLTTKKANHLVRMWNSFGIQAA